ncbi:MAG: site-specific integrase [Roseibium sp.]|uniref:tyrosine-type recombinase/integrase n=1 Tax=Roseibium sp. TaxID=1936156 RepID=UPI001B095661|nr:site-specific integrase [Roseibium sp.]MBO6891607.1 site-specific integrase [Roseibium sp.]MBO6931650.1 site-specific integrase [Roseibium sp.]
MHAPTALTLYFYQTHMKEARGLDAKTISARMRHLGQFAASLGEKELSKLTQDDIIGFKKTLNATDNGENPGHRSLAAPTVVQTCHDLKTFLEWLSKEPGYRSLQRDLADYCTPPRRLTTIAHTPKTKHIPSAADIISTLNATPDTTLQDRRDRAVIACLFLTGVRDGALVSLRLKHMDINRRCLHQDAREVKTKFSKTMQTNWFPVGNGIAAIVTDWVEERRTFGAQDDDPLFPRTPSAVRGPNSDHKEAFWKTTSPIRQIIRKATEAAGVQYFKPHSVRATLARMCLTWARTPEELKALSQNLGHENISTTMEHYATLSDDRQRELVLGMSDRDAKSEENMELVDLIYQLPSESRRVLKATAQALIKG